LNQHFSIPHPNLARFIEALQSFEQQTFFDHVQIAAGKYLPEINKRSAVKEMKLLKLTMNFDNYEVENYFKALSFIYLWKFK
jgi:hypothetical protein